MATSQGLHCVQWQHTLPHLRVLSHIQLSADSCKQENRRDHPGVSSVNMTVPWHVNAYSKAEIEWGKTAHHHHKLPAGSLGLQQRRNEGANQVSHTISRVTQGRKVWAG